MQDKTNYGYSAQSQGSASTSAESRWMLCAAAATPGPCATGPLQEFAFTTSMQASWLAFWMGSETAFAVRL